MSIRRALITTGVVAFLLGGTRLMLPIARASTYSRSPYRDLEEWGLALAFCLMAIMATVAVVLFVYLMVDFVDSVVLKKPKPRKGNPRHEQNHPNNRPD